MKIIRFAFNGAVANGILENGRVYTLPEASFSDALVAVTRNRGAIDRSGGVALEKVRLLPPLDTHNKIFAVALNYEGHIREARQSKPESPIIFMKPYDAIAAPGDPIPRPSVTQQLDYEGELAIVMGRECFHVAPEEAVSCIAGITAFNDTSARDLLKVNAGASVMLDWFSSKCLDGLTPIGPAVVTLDEVESRLREGDLTIVTRVNDKEVQRARITDMIFDIPTLIAFVTSRVRLRPGDVIATGTPPGIGASAGRYLKLNDVVEVDIDPIPVLRNTIM